METRNSELYHYGVKGMKWGVRKARSGGKDADMLTSFRSSQKKYELLDKNTSTFKQAVKAGLLGYWSTPNYLATSYASSAELALKKLNKKYDKVIEENGQDIKTGEYFVRTTLKKGKDTWVSEDRVYQK